MIVRLQCDALHGFAVDVADVVVRGESLVEHRPVGVEKLVQAEIALPEFAEKRRRFADHAFLQIRVVVGIDFLAVLEPADTAQLQPLARERVGEG